MPRPHHATNDDDIWDERGLLRDGKKYRVSLMAMDSASIAARAQLTDAERLSLDSCKPGYRYATDSAAARAAKQRARDAYRQVCDDLENSWRNPDPDGQLGISTEGDQCTVRQGGYDEGSPGHLRRIGNNLICVPDDYDPDDNDNGFNSDRRSVRDAKERAYEQYERELRDAWRQGK
jgi:hypothetical protein